MAVRSYHAVAYVKQPYPQTDLLFMYGGDNGATLDDLWVMDTNVQGKNKTKSTGVITLFHENFSP